MLKKLFSTKPMPTNEGTFSHIHTKLGKVRYKKHFDLELSNMEGIPTYELTHQLTIGSEIGNIIIADPSVSPRHATFVLQQDIVSIIDHGSIAGTLVNGKKIASGKYIILEETDVIQVGDLEVKVKTRNETIRDEEEEIPEIPEIPREEFKAKEEAPIKDEKPALTIVAEDNGRATNSLIRVVAVLCDLFLAYSILIVFLPFDDFREFLNFIPSAVSEVLGIDWKSFFEAVGEDHGYLAEMLKDVFSFFSSTFHFGPLLITFALLRFISTLVLSVSISEFILGVRSKGNVLWARLGGGLRVLVGLITWPFVIFDVPSVVSRRTFKEFITFTQTYSSSKFRAIIGTLLLFPLTFALAIIAPLFEGLEFPHPIYVSDKIDQRVKVANGDSVGAVTLEYSKFFSVEANIRNDNVSIAPLFRFQGKESKLNFKNQLVFYHKDIQRMVVLSVLKNFDFRELLSIGLKGNPFLFDRFPEIYNFAYSSSESSPVFRASKDEKTEARFANEFILFTKTALELSSENAFEVMQEYTPLIKSLVDYKSSLINLIEYKDFDKIDFIKVGNVTFLRFSYIKQRPFDLIIPLKRDEGRIYKIEYDKREDLGSLSSKFYKYTLEKSNWLPDDHRQPSESVTAFEAIDIVSALASSKKIDAEKALALYGYYFEKSAMALQANDAKEYEVWKAGLDSIFRIIETLFANSQAANEEDPRAKLYQNFRDLREAFEVKNLSYFGISNSTSI